MRLWGLVVAVALLVGGFLLGRKLEGDASAANAKVARDGAERSAQEVVATLERMLANFQAKAQGASSSDQFRAMVLQGVDEATFHDSLTSEKWSASYRNRGGSVTVFVGEGRVGSSPSMLELPTLKAVALEAEVTGEASKLVPHRGIYLVAAARMPFEVTDGSKVAVVLTRPIGQEELDGFIRAPLLITDGKEQVGAHGEVLPLLTLMGKEAEGSVTTPAGVAVARPAGALWVWTLQPVGATATPAVPVPAVWGGALLLAIGAVLATTLAARKRDPSLQVTEPAGAVVAVDSRGATPSQLGAALDSTSPSHGGGKRYHEVAPLGEGGMAKVSIAVTHGAEGFRRVFVVKRLKTELTVNPEIVAQFIDEARLGASLVHSNIVPVFDFGRDAEGYFIAQEYIMGRDLDAVRRSLFELHRATLDLPLVLYVAQEALKALSYAHAKTNDEGRPLGLVHRDVSPNNLMISARGELKLLDFGIVKAEGKLSHTQTGMIKGNVFYMSPEQARGLPVDSRSDLFSLGLVLFTACSGEPLYRGNSNYELLTRAAEGLSNEEWARVERLPQVLADLLKRVLQFDPNGRFSSAEEFAHALPAGQVGSAASMQQLMEALFKGDFTSERTRFSVSSITGARR